MHNRCTTFCNQAEGFFVDNQMLINIREFQIITYLGLPSFLCSIISICIGRIIQKSDYKIQIIFPDYIIRTNLSTKSPKGFLLLIISDFSQIVIIVILGFRQRLF